MCAFPLNTSPLMTRHLVEQCGAFAGDPVVIMDVGARGGLNTEWTVFGDQMRVYCFEPDEEECSRLAAEAPPQVVYIPTALGRETGEATLFESKLAFSTGLYKTRMDYFGRFVNRDNGIVVAERTISVKSLHDTMRTFGIGHIDFLKLDAEGAELDILQGGGDELRSGRLLGILSEIRLHEEINGSAPFASLDAYVRGMGLRLYNLDVNHHSRVALPYPQLNDYRLPSGERFYAYTAHGQVQDGDALYFRDLFNVPECDPRSILKLCALMEIYMLNDCAAELIVANMERLATIADPEQLLDLLTRGVTGSEARYHEYIASYFSSATQGTAGSQSVQATNSASHGGGERAAGLLHRLLRRLIRS